MKTPGRIIQITGLPRSGTAFMTALTMLSPEVNAFHECIADGPGWKERIQKSRLQYPITVDAGTYQYMPGAVIEDAQKFAIVRDSMESHLAAEKALGRRFSLESSESLDFRFKFWMRKYEVSYCVFHAIFKLDILKLVWDGLKLGEFPESKVRQLIRMRIVRKDLELFSEANAAVSAHELL